MGHSLTMPQKNHCTLNPFYMWYSIKSKTSHNWIVTFQEWKHFIGMALTSQTVWCFLFTLVKRKQLHNFSPLFDLCTFIPRCGINKAKSDMAVSCLPWFVCHIVSPAFAIYFSKQKTVILCPMLFAGGMIVWEKAPHEGIFKSSTYMQTPFWVKQL